MTHRTPAGRLAARAGHYAAYTLAFLLVYGGLRVVLGGFPRWLVFAILLGSLAKDLIDERRLRRGGQPLAYAGVEHAPSNAVLLVFLATGVVSVPGTVAGLPAGYWAGGLAVLDLAFDLSQDLRA